MSINALSMLATTLLVAPPTSETDVGVDASPANAQEAGILSLPNSVVRISAQYSSGRVRTASIEPDGSVTRDGKPMGKISADGIWVDQGEREMLRVLENLNVVSSGGSSTGVKLVPGGASFSWGGRATTIVFDESSEAMLSPAGFGSPVIKASGCSGDTAKTCALVAHRVLLRGEDHFKGTATPKKNLVLMQNSDLAEDGTVSAGNGAAARRTMKSLRRGDFIVTKRGSLRKVVGASGASTGGRHRIATEPASFEDVMLEVDGALDTDIHRFSFELPKAPLSMGSLSVDIIGGEVVGSVEIQGDIKRKKGGPLRTTKNPVHLTAAIALEDVVFRVSGAISESASHTLAAKSTTITVFVGGVPIVFVVKASVDLTVTAKADFSTPLVFELDAYAPVTVACQRVDCLDVDVHMGRTGKFSLVPRKSGRKKSALTGELEVKATGKVEVLLYDTAGFSVTIEPRITAACPSGKLGFQIDADVSVDLHLLSDSWSESAYNDTLFERQGTFRCPRLKR